MEFARFLDRYLDDFLSVASIFFCGAVVCGIIYISYYFFKNHKNAIFGFSGMEKEPAAA